MDLDGAFTDTIDPTSLASLRERVGGTVLVRGDEARAAVASHNTLRTVDPDVVVVAASEEDVATALRFASDEDLPVHVHSTGHGTMRDVTGGLVVSTVELDDVGIDPATRLASIGAGVRWSTVIDAAAVHGLTPITGSSPGVGVVGYVLGGGLGPLARSHGYTSDRVRGFRVALVDGSLVDATADTLDRGGPGPGLVPRDRRAPRSRACHLRPARAADLRHGLTPTGFRRTSVTTSRWGLRADRHVPEPPRQHAGKVASAR